MSTKYVPAGWRILIEVVPNESAALKDYKRTQSSGLLAIPEEVIKAEVARAKYGAEEAIVLDLGEYAYDVRFKTKPWCKIGSEVLFVKNSGRDFSHRDYQEEEHLGRFRIINDEDILATIVNVED